jgi:hypothetical protein
MTSDQSNRIYFPLWRGAFAANWRLENGVPVLLDKPANPHLAGQIDGLARATARSQFRALKVDDLRYASHVVFLAAEKSSKDITNKELDLLLANYKLLVNPDDLSAVMGVQHPDQAARIRQIHALERCGKPEALLQEWCSYFNGGRRDWRDLPSVNFNRFVGYVWKRVKGGAAGNVKAKQAAAKPEGARPEFDPYAGRRTGGPFGANRTGD